VQGGADQKMFAVARRARAAANAADATTDATGEVLLDYAVWRWCAGAMAKSQKKDAFRVSRLELFFIAVICQIVLPLTPLLSAVLNRGRVSHALLAATIPLYLLALASSSRQAIGFVAGLAFGFAILFLVGTGIDVDPEKFQLAPAVWFFVVGSAFCSAVGFAVDRFLFHVVDGEPFGMWQAKE
jgi:hypothetical protein